ncbi:hypothetical protein ABZX95_36120 [Streptomyces sp. NPDC004232]|nr:hypothetical protein [Streptomyces sp. tea 10]
MRGARGSVPGGSTMLKPIALAIGVFIDALLVRLPRSAGRPTSPPR